MNTLKSILGISLILLIFVTGCGQESTGDAMAREQDRERERQHYLDKQNQQINGIYQGETDNADIFLKVESTKISTGATSPTSALAGSLVIVPRIDLSARNQKIQYYFPFADGGYDPNGGDAEYPGGRMTFTLEKEGRPSIVSCKVGKNKVLNCVWNITSNAQFILSPSTPKSYASLTAENTNDIVYTGQDDRFNIMVEFDSEVVSRDNSKIPEPTISGYIVFFAKSNEKIFPDPNSLDLRSSFKNGTYDVLGGRVTVTLDEDSHITLMCKIINKGESLKCKYHSRLSREFTLKRTARVR